MICAADVSLNDDRSIQDVCVVNYVVQPFPLFLWCSCSGSESELVRWWRNGDGFDLGIGDGRGIYKIFFALPSNTDFFRPVYSIFQWMVKYPILYDISQFSTNGAQACIHDIGHLILLTLFHYDLLWSLSLLLIVIIAVIITTGLIGLFHATNNFVA